MLLKEKMIWKLFEKYVCCVGGEVFFSARFTYITLMDIKELIVGLQVYKHIIHNMNNSDNFAWRFDN